MELINVEQWPVDLLSHAMLPLQDDTAKSQKERESRS